MRAISQARQLAQVILGMVLHRPERSALVGHAHRLNAREGVCGEAQRAAREMRDLVLVRDERIEDAGLSDVEGMAAPVLGEGDLACDAHFPAAGIRRTPASRRDDRDLGRPAAPEARHPRFERGTGELDLRPYRRIVVVVDGEAGAGPRDPVVGGQRCPMGQGAAGVRRMENVDRGVRVAVEQHPLVELARGGRAGRGQTLAPLPAVPVDDEKMQEVHREATRRRRRDARSHPAGPRPVRILRPRCCPPDPGRGWQ